MKKTIVMVILGYIVLSQISCKDDDPIAKCSFVLRGATYVPEKAICYEEDQFTVRTEAYYLNVQENGRISFFPDNSIGIYGGFYGTDSATIIRNGNNFSFSGNLDEFSPSGEIMGSGYYISGDCSCVGP